MRRSVSEVRVRQSSAVENASLPVLSLADSSSVLENASTTVSISGLPLVDSTFVFEQDPVPYLFSRPVGEVSFRPGSPLAVSSISSATFPILSPDRADFSLSGFSLVHSGSNLLPPGVALPLEDFDSSSSVAPADLPSHLANAVVDKPQIVADLSLIECPVSGVSGLLAAGA